MDSYHGCSDAARWPVWFTVAMILGCGWQYCHEMGKSCGEAGREKLYWISASQGLYELLGELVKNQILIQKL